MNDTTQSKITKVEEKLSREESKLKRLQGQLDLVDVDMLNVKVDIIGAGGIGSWTTLLLAKMGMENITVHDFDKVETHNVASQFFEEKDIDSYKVLALKKNVLKQTGVKIKTEIDKRKQLDIDSRIVVIAIDSMQGRHDLEEMLSSFLPKHTIIIDGRMSGLQMEIHTCMLGDYKLTLEPVDEVIEQVCTAKSISFNGSIIGGIIASRVWAIIDNISMLPTYESQLFKPSEFRMMFNGSELSTITNNDLSTEFTMKRDELVNNPEE